INLPSKNFNGIISVQGGDISITGSGQLRSLQGNGIVRLNGTFQVSRVNLSGGSQLVAQQGSTQTFTDKIIFATSATSRVILKSSGTQPASFGFTDYYKLCFDNIDVTSINIVGNSIVNAGPGGTLTSATGWVKANCSDLVFPDFSISNTCVGSSVYFIDKSSGPISSRSWNFGDPSSGTNNASSLVNPLHFYATSGPFTATLTVTGPAGSRPISKTVTLAANALSSNSVQMNNGSLISTTLSPSYQWLRDGQIISGATSRSYDFNFTPGEYSVLIFNETCNRRSSPFLITAIEDDPPAPSQVVKLYPNPTSEVLQIESANEVLSLSILDALGREFRSPYEKTDKTRYRVDVSAVPSGLYIVKLSTSLKTEVLKLVIRK
ncbi:MAG: T9SS type A sorting domain-containing protein, partial [Cyclobacteriaceae bacterium]|nr:T9SS type A sorting domain-containing protein [Cyclobacteriaceae bacterium]